MYTKNNIFRTIIQKIILIKLQTDINTRYLSDWLLHLIKNILEFSSHVYIIKCFMETIICFYETKLIIIMDSKEAAIFYAKVYMRNGYTYIYLYKFIARYKNLF